MMLGTKVQYKTVRGWSGKKYQVRMTAAEIEVRRICGLIFAAVIVMPVWVLIMALAAGMI